MTRALLLLAVTLSAGCYDLDELGRLYAPDGAEGEDQAPAANADAARHDLSRAVADFAGAADDAAIADDTDAAGEPPDLLGEGCGFGEARCAGACIDVQADVDNCGQCGLACPKLAHGAAACAGGRCGVASCDPGFGDCNGLAGDGCEANLAADGLNCGACDQPCAQGSVCSGGACAMGCQAPLILCGPGCVDPRIDPAHCGGCAGACPAIANGAPGCTGGMCGVGQCNPGSGNCDGNPGNGCEAALLTDAANCGACGKACGAVPNGAPGCKSGACGVGACKATFGDCDGAPQNGCEATLLTDVANCGRCGAACANVANGSRACVGGGCAIGGCNAGFADCDKNLATGCEAALLSDPANCGACAAPCAFANAAATCAGGHCALGACKANFADCDKNPANGCEANLLSDVANCGGCGAACASCANGACPWWTPQVSNAGVSLDGVWGSGAADVYATGGNGKVDHTLNQGVTWALKILPGANMNGMDWFYGVWGSGPGNVLVVGGGPTIQRSTDGGKTWALQPSPVMGELLLAIWGSADSDIYAVGSTGTILHSANGGAAWSAQTSGTVEQLSGVWGSSKNDVYAVGAAGVLLHTVNGGATWTAQAVAGNPDLYAVWGSGAGDVYAVGDLGVIVHSTGNGQWAAQKSGSAQLLRGVWGSRDSDVYVVGWRGAILHSTNGGAQWTAQAGAGGMDVNAVWGSGPNDVYAVGQAGLVLHHP